MKNIKISKKVTETLLVTVGTFLLSLSVEMFILPYDILSGGVAGIAVALEPFLHIDTTLFTNILVVVLLIAGSLILGKEFFFQTFLSSVEYTIFNSILAQVIIPPTGITAELASLYAGLIGGLGIGMVMRAGASTGGMDVPPLIIHKLFGFKINVLVGITDGLTVLLGVAAYDIGSALIGLVSVFATSWAIGRVLSYGEGSNAKSVQFISEHYEEIVHALQSELDRGCTITRGIGGYRGDERIVVLTVVSQKQYSRLLEIINRYDEKAFVITTDATDMHGEGFTFGYKI